MRNATYDAIVVGVGGVGSSTLYQLAKHGLKVLGIDRFAPGHNRGSSHGETRAIRKAYFEHPDYVPLLNRAYELWHELNATTEQAVFYQTGILEVGLPNGALLPGIRKAARQHKLKIEELDACEVGRRFPGFRAPEGNAAIYEPEGGYLLVEESVKLYVKLASMAGASLAIGQSVKNWSWTAGDIHVQTDTDTFRTKYLVITAGAWSNDLISSRGIQLRVLRKHQLWYAPEPDAYRQDSSSPVFFYETPDGCYYGCPTLATHAEPMVKIAEHTGGKPVADPLNCNREIDEDDRQRVEKFMAKYMPSMTNRQLRHEVCMYTMSDDEHFVVDRHPDYSNVVFAAGLSGHGFKFASVLGETLAGWVMGTVADSSLQFLSSTRFKNPD